MEMYESPAYKSIVRILTIMESKGSSVFLDYSGHVKQLHVRVMAAGYDNSDETNFSETAYIREEDFGESLESLLLKLSKYSVNEYPKDLKTQGIAKVVKALENLSR
jgi:hypothetical protein